VIKLLGGHDYMFKTNFSGQIKIWRHKQF